MSGINEVLEDIKPKTDEVDVNELKKEQVEFNK